MPEEAEAEPPDAEPNKDEVIIIIDMPNLEDEQELIIEYIFRFIRLQTIF